MSATHPAFRGTDDRGGSKWLAVTGLAVVGVLAGAVYLAVSQPVTPDVVVQEVREVPPLSSSPRVAAPPNLQGTTATGASSGSTSTNGEAAAEPTCQGPQPGPSWSCHPEGWQVGPPPAPVASGGGRIDRAGGCLTEQPGNGFTCQNGLWVLAGTSSNSLAGPGQNQAAGEPDCRAPRPGNDWVCENGAWIPPTLAPVPTATPPATGAPEGGVPNAPASPSVEPIDATAPAPSPSGVPAPSEAGQTQPTP